MNSAKLARTPGAPRNAGRMVHEWTRMNTNQTHSFLISFVWIRVHSWTIILAFFLGVLATMARTECNAQTQNLRNEPNGGVA